MISGEVINVIDYGADPTGVADSTSAIQAAINFAIANAAAGGYGLTIYLPVGKYLVSSTLTVSYAGTSFVRLVGEGYNSYIKYTGTGPCLSFTSPSFSSYATHNLRFELQDFSVIGDNVVGSTGISLTYCSETRLERVMVSNFDTGIYIYDSPGLLMESCVSMINLGKGLHMVHDNSVPGFSDMAVISIYGFLTSGSPVGIYIDGGRDINFFGGSCNNIQPLVLRAESLRIEAVRFYGVFFDFADDTSTTIQVGDLSDNTYYINEASFYDCYYGSHIPSIPSNWTKSIFSVETSLMFNLNIIGGYYLEATPSTGNFVKLCPSSSGSTVVNIQNIGQNNCIAYRVLDARNGTSRTQIFQTPPDLQLNPTFKYYPLGYLPFGIHTSSPANTIKQVGVGVTDNVSIQLAAATPSVRLSWYPQQSVGTTAEECDTFVVEWIAKAVATPISALLKVTTSNVGGGGIATVQINPDLCSKIQVYTSVAGANMERWIAVYKVPLGRVLNSFDIFSSDNEDSFIDYFNVYGLIKHRPDYLIYEGAVADFATAAFKLNTYRGLTVLQQITGGSEVDSLNLCVKDAGTATYTWKLIS